MDPCRPAIGRQDRATGVLTPSGRATGCFCKICTARNFEMLCKGPPESMSPGHWATGPLLGDRGPVARPLGDRLPAPYKMCLRPPPPEAVWERKISAQKKRGTKHNRAER